MSDTIIRVENLGKKYIIGHQQQGAASYATLRDTLSNTAKSLLKSFQNPKSKIRNNKEEFWALQDVSFEVKQGETVGIIGRNGAGKSTLLKILSRITEPTTGRIELNGRVASLLEVGTGFHPELTGRENIYLNGAILGMSRVEIRRKFDEIVDFAEVERFLDTPVKRYSSGMYVRLAFAVAAHLEPEILVVDEVLAVGDAAFQKKCLGKMGDVATKEGRTVLFVSHNMAAVKSLCKQVVFLENGKIKGQGEMGEIIANYLTIARSASNERIWDNPANAPGNSQVKWYRVGIRPEFCDHISEFTVATPLVAEFEFWNSLDNVTINFSLHLFSIEGIRILNTASQPKICSKGLIKGYCYIPCNFLNDQFYRIDIMIIQETSRILHHLEDALVFEIHDIERDTNCYGKWEGIIRPKFPWKVEEERIFADI